MKVGQFASLCALLCLPWNDHRAVRAQDPTEPEDFEALTETLSEIQAEGDTVGFGVAILDTDGTVRYTNAFGQADKENGRPYIIETVQMMASISKTLIGVSLFKLQELGLLALDDPINNYLPFSIKNPFHCETPITIRHLAQHKGSLRDTDHIEKTYIFAEPVPATIYRELRPGTNKRRNTRKEVKIYNSNMYMPLQDYIYNIYHPDGEWYRRKNFLNKAPGTKERYSNNGATIASMVIEGALCKADMCDMSYEDFTRTYILDPLGMEDSGWDLADYDDTAKVRLYPFGKSPIPDFKLITLADGGLVTSVKDFSKFVGAVMRGFFFGEETLLTSASYQEMLAFGEGIFWQTLDGDETAYLIGHTGGDPGIITGFLINTLTKQGYIYMSNTSEDTDDLLAAAEAMGAFVV